MNIRVILAEDLFEDAVYSKDVFQEAIRQHFKSFGYGVDFVWFSNYTFFD